MSILATNEHTHFSTSGSRSLASCKSSPMNTDCCCRSDFSRLWLEEESVYMHQPSEKVCFGLI